MPVASQIFFGVIPSILMTVGGLSFAGYISSTYQWVLLASALLGTSGLIWALVGYTRIAAPAVLILLVIGVFGIVVGGLGGALSALAADVQNKQLGSPLGLLLRALLVAWLVLGPASVGLIQAHAALRRIRAVA